MLSSTDIKTWLRGDVDFIGVFALNRIPNFSNRYKPLKFIVNTDPINLPGTHWIAVWRNAMAEVEIFDSFGMLPAGALQLWCNANCDRCQYNRQSIQNPNTQLCGTYVCCLFLQFRHKFKSMEACIRYLSK